MTAERLATSFMACEIVLLNLNSGSVRSLIIDLRTSSLHILKLNLLDFTLEPQLRLRYLYHTQILSPVNIVF